MKILIVAATEHEANLGTLALHEYKRGHIIYKGKFEIHVVITGTGLIKTVFHLTEHIVNKHYDLIVNIGICGAFDRTLYIGDVLRIERDRFADWGMLDNKDFKDVFEMGLEDENSFPFEHGWIRDALPPEWLNLTQLKAVDGFTVNTIRVHNLNRFDQQIYAETESMEGAAFLYVCRQLNSPCIQIRSVSNYVGERDKSKWDILKALQSLSTFLNSKMFTEA